MDNVHTFVIILFVNAWLFVICSICLCSERKSSCFCSWSYPNLFLRKYNQVCGPKCAEGARHQAECKLLAGQEHPTYAPVIATYWLWLSSWVLLLIVIDSDDIANCQVTPLRMLLLQEGGGDRWLRLVKDHSGDQNRFAGKRGVVWWSACLIA